MKKNLAFDLNSHLAKRINKEQEIIDNVKKRPQFPAPTKVESSSSTAGEAANNHEEGEKAEISENKNPSVGQKTFISTHKSDDINDYRDSEDIVEQKVNVLAELIKTSKSFIIYTGAGISTSAKIPDYRSKTGVWTLLEKGEKVEKKIEIDQAEPTIAHNAINTLVNANICKFVVSTNIDGLHRKSGIPADKIAEIHGNCYLESCVKCKKEYLREFSCMNKGSFQLGDNTDDIHKIGEEVHLTGRICEVDGCGGMLRDSIVKFGENLIDKELQNANRISEEGDLALVLGSSMRVSPACNMPRRVLRNQQRGKLVVVNFQMTPFEDEIWLHIHSEIDTVMNILLTKLADLIKK